MTKLLLAAALALMTPIAAANAAPRTDVPATLPVVVQGAYPGYTDQAVSQLVRSCVAAPANSSGTALTDWQLNVALNTEYMPDPTMRVTASLARDGRTIAVRWAQTSPSAPAQDLCHTVANLTQQIWPSFDSQAG